MSAPRSPTMDTSGHGQATVGEELRRMVANTGFALKLATNRIELPAATPSDGPDPYGDPDPEWLRIDWREHLREVEVVGTPVNFVDIGDGPPLLLVHGLSGCWQNWLENIPHFARTHRVIAPDLPGFGASPMPPWELTIPAYGRFLRDFCERLGIERTAIAGNSMGGFIATEVAVAEPRRISRLALVSAAGVTWARARREPAALIGRLVRVGGPLVVGFQLSAGIRRARARQLAFRGIFHEPRALRPELLWENVVPALKSPGYFDALTNLVGYDIRHRLEEIEEPTLIVWGRNDRVVPVPAALSYQRRIGDNTRLEIFDRTGHLPQLERPMRFNRVLERFLAE